MLTDETKYQQRIAQLEREVADLKAKLTAKQKATRYGLVWEDVPEAFEQEAENKIPILEEVKDKAIKNDDGKPTHILIEGDNYHALQCLNYTHRGKVDVIYIDPPYNTGATDGQDPFIYRDKRVLEKYPNGTTVPKDSPLRHSYWLSFMSKRLELAKNLLSPNGVIFISIDDNEQANLKLLCDKIFKSDSYQATLHIQVRYADKSLTEEKPFKPLMEYVLVYSKPDYIPKREIEDYSVEKFCYKITELSEGYKFNSNGQDVILFRKNEWKIEKVESSLIGLKETWITGSIYTKMSYGKVFQTIIEPRIDVDGLNCLYKVIGRGDDGLGYRYYTGPAKKTARFGKMFSGIPLDKLEEIKNGFAPKRLLPIVTMYDYAADFGNIRTEGGVPYNSGKKPIKMLSQLIELHCNKDAIVLDFFAGSASTLHATLTSNERDKGNRQCILIQCNEKNICEEVAYKRCENVMNKLGNSLKYYRTAFVGDHDAATATDEDKVVLAHKAGCLIAIAENTLEEVEANNTYQIFQDGTRYTAVYFSGNLVDMPEFTEKVESLRNSSRLTKIEVYIYCLGNVQQFENEFDSLHRINLHAIPQPIIEIYKQLNA